MPLLCHVHLTQKYQQIEFIRLHPERFSWIPPGLIAKEEGVMLTGVIKRLLKNIGYVFIKSSYGHEVFSHYSQLYGAVFDQLNEGQSVKFSASLSPKGFKAVTVEPVTENSKGDSYIRNLTEQTSNVVQPISKAEISAALSNTK
jgi:cold shock CspA family protein